MKWTNPQTGQQRKTIYHSYLCNEPGLVIQFTGEVRASQYPNQPPVVGFQVMGYAEQYNLQIENQTIGSVISTVPQNTWVTYQAAGKAESAVIQFAPYQGEVIAPVVTTPAALAPPQASFTGWQTPAAGGAPVAVPPASGTNKLMGNIASIREPFPYRSIDNAYAVALAAAHRLLDGADSTPTDERELAASMMYCQRELFKQFGTWLPLSSDDLPELATLDELENLNSLFAEYGTGIADAAASQAIVKVLSQGVGVASQEHVTRCTELLEQVKETQLAQFTPEALEHEDDLPF